MELRSAVESGLVEIRKVDPAELTPGELAVAIRQQVESGTRIVAIDSLNGYLSAMHDERFLILHLHELLSYLNQQGVLSILVMAQHGIMGQEISSPVDLSYLADTVILLRYFEAFGQVRQAIATVKRRSGAHERSVREMRIGPIGIRIGRELEEFHGILSGRLEYTGKSAPLLENNDARG
jgi:circadian clock protein KaiC